MAGHSPDAWFLLPPGVLQVCWVPGTIWCPADTKLQSIAFQRTRSVVVGSYDSSVACTLLLCVAICQLNRSEVRLVTPCQLRLYCLCNLLVCTFQFARSLLLS